MKARKYNRRVQIWQTNVVHDGYGGYKVTEALKKTSWANIETVGNNSRYVTRLSELGINDPLNTIIVRLRYRNDITYNAINQFIKYRGAKYIIQNAPSNINFMDTEIEILATREQTTEVTT